MSARRFVCLGILLLIGGLVSPYSYAAGSIATATVTSVRVDADGKGMVFFSSALAGTPPGCVSSPYFNALAFDTSTSGGKAALALALAAKSSGSLITAYGTGNCGVYGNFVESFDYGEML